LRKEAEALAEAER